MRCEAILSCLDVTEGVRLLQGSVVATTVFWGAKQRSLTANSLTAPQHYDTHGLAFQTTSGHPPVSSYGVCLWLIDQAISRASTSEFLERGQASLGCDVEGLLQGKP
jgi:hypothetical protein